MVQQVSSNTAQSNGHIHQHRQQQQHQTSNQQQLTSQQQQLASQQQPPPQLQQRTASPQTYSQPLTPDKLFNSPQQPHHPAEPPAPHHQEHRPKVILLPLQQHGYISNKQGSQLRPTINLQGLQYINVFNDVYTTQAQQGNISPAAHAVPSTRGTHQTFHTTPGTPPPQEVHVTSPATIKTQPSSRYDPLQYHPHQVGHAGPNSNVIMIQPLHQGTRTSCTLSYNLSTNLTVLQLYHTKLTPHNGAHIDQTKTFYMFPVAPLFKREQMCCAKSPNTPLNLSYCAAASDKTVYLTNCEDCLSSTASEHSMVDHVEPEVISMILNNTNMDNFNLDSRYPMDP